MTYKHTGYDWEPVERHPRPIAILGAVLAVIGELGLYGLALFGLYQMARGRR